MKFLYELFWVLFIIRHDLESIWTVLGFFLSFSCQGSVNTFAASYFQKSKIRLLEISSKVWLSKAPVGCVCFKKESTKIVIVWFQILSFSQILFFGRKIHRESQESKSIEYIHFQSRWERFVFVSFVNKWECLRNLSSFSQFEKE